MCARACVRAPVCVRARVHAQPHKLRDAQAGAGARAPVRARLRAWPRGFCHCARSHPPQPLMHSLLVSQFACVTRKNAFRARAFARLCFCHCTCTHPPRPHCTDCVFVIQTQSLPALDTKQSACLCVRDSDPILACCTSKVPGTPNYSARACAVPVPVPCVVLGRAVLRACGQLKRRWTTMSSDPNIISASFNGACIHSMRRSDGGRSLESSSSPGSLAY